MAASGETLQPTKENPIIALLLNMAKPKSPGSGQPAPPLTEYTPDIATAIMAVAEMPDIKAAVAGGNQSDLVKKLQGAHTPMTLEQARLLVAAAYKIAGVELQPWPAETPAVAPNPGITALLTLARAQQGDPSTPISSLPPELATPIFAIAGITDIKEAVASGDPNSLVAQLQKAHPFDPIDARAVVNAAYAMAGQEPKWPAEGGGEGGTRSKNPLIKEEGGKTFILSRNPAEWNLRDNATRKRPDIAKEIYTNDNHNLSMILGGPLEIGDDLCFTDGIVGGLSKRLQRYEEISGVLQDWQKAENQVRAQKQVAKGQGAAEAYFDRIFDPLIRIDVALSQQPHDLEGIRTSDFQVIGISGIPTDAQQVLDALRRTETNYESPNMGNYFVYKKVMKDAIAPRQRARSRYVKLAAQINNDLGKPYNPDTDDHTFRPWVTTEIQKLKPVIVLVEQLERYFTNIQNQLPIASELQAIINRLNTFGANPTAANTLIAELSPRIHLAQAVSSPNAPTELQKAAEAIVKGQTNQIPKEQQFLLDIIKTLQGSGQVEGRILSKDDYISLEEAKRTEVVDNINDLYGYLDGGRTYPVTLDATTTLPALRQWVNGLLNDPELPNDLGRPEGPKLKELPINKVTFDSETQATVNITVRVKKIGNMPYGVELVIQDTGSGINVDLKDPGIKRMVQEDPEYKDTYALINQLPDLLRKHMNRQLKHNEVTGFRMQKGFIINGGPKSTE